MNKVELSGNIVGNTATNEKLYVYRQGTETKKSVVNFFLSVPMRKKMRTAITLPTLSP